MKSKIDKKLIVPLKSDIEILFISEQRRVFSKNKNHLNFLKMEYQYEGINKDDY